MTREAPNQSNIRDHYAAHGVRLWRNNVGALQAPSGQLVRFGLANDTAAMNRTTKSGDLIGWEPRLITPEMVGEVIAQFWSIECKRSGWKYDPRDPDQVAQNRWGAMVRREGGVAGFMSEPGRLIVP